MVRIWKSFLFWGEFRVEGIFYCWYFFEEVIREISLSCWFCMGYFYKVVFFGVF